MAADGDKSQGADAPPPSPAFDLNHDRYNILVEFAYKHVNFQRAELESVLSMGGITLGVDCDVVRLPFNVGHGGGGGAAGDYAGYGSRESAGGSEGAGIKRRKPCNKPPIRSFMILSFPLEALGSKFRHDIAACSSGTTDGGDGNGNGKSSPLPDLASILSRCTLIRSVMELWGAGTTIEKCSFDARKFSEGSATGRRTLERHRRPDRSWKVTVHTLGSKYSREEQNAMRNNFAFLDFGGPVKMEGQDDEFILIREIELDGKGGPVHPRHGLGKKLIPENDARPPLAAYFGRILGGMSRNWRADLEKYSLKKRAYLGPTSMDSELSLIMTNLARVGPGCLAFDPFVGTGSILLTCGLRGAYCFGTDIDIRVLRGRGDGEGRNVLSNFRQYDLPRPDLVRSDNSLYQRHYRPHVPLYDAIVTDPPYGIRAGARRSGSRREVRPVPDSHRHDHIAQTKPYAVSDVMADLLDVAARTLVMGGRLVYVIPSMTDFDEATDLPRHDCLRLVYTCYQPLQSMELGRRVVTVEKVAEYDPSRREEYMSKVWINGPESAEKCANIRDRLIEAARQKPGYEEKAAVRKQKRKATRQAKKRAKREAIKAMTPGLEGAETPSGQSS